MTQQSGRGGQRERQLWFPLDNSAKVFPAIRTTHISAAFRLSVLLTETIDPITLLQALDDILPRFPGFSMRLRSGVFWFYLERNPLLPAIYPDTRFPCRYIFRKDNRSFLFRVIYYENRISVEFFHSLTDGNGGMIFLKTLTARYLTLMGCPIPAVSGVLPLDEKPLTEEMEDATKRYARPVSFISRRQTPAWHLKGKIEPKGRIHVISARVPLAKIKEKASGFGVSVNDLLVAAYIEAFSRLQAATERQPRKPIVIAVPVNMRQYYPSLTLRNFFQRLFVSLNPGYRISEFEEILAIVHHSIRLQKNEKDLNARMYTNLKSEQKLALRLIPLVLKNWILRLAFRFYGDSRITSTLTNMGQVIVPTEMWPHVESFEVIMGPSRDNVINCAVVSFGQELVINFSRRIGDATIERLMLNRLVKLGIPVKVQSNSESPIDAISESETVLG
ncbi:MAG: alcohol acetyltransferase [Saccharofermentanales bacterium]|jgi:NRPS condensation-like uncharacterized protein